MTCFVCNSENGSITSELLCSMLKHIDDCCVFDRTDGVLPFLLLDSHGSRFKLLFLEYTNDMVEEGHKWCVCIGVPYGTSVWQVGDSAEQNGSFKMAMVRAKMKLFQNKADYHLDFVVEKLTSSFLFVKHGKSLLQLRQQTRKRSQTEVGDLSTMYC